jgi:CDP-6-deoxy-D-xylo-4-hexulose-3-dehydrase
MVGDIVFARFPMADKPVFKARPCLVISSADELGDFEVLKISSKPSATDVSIKLESELFEFGGVPLESWIIVTDVAKTNFASISNYCGRLKAPAVTPILKLRIEASTRIFSRLAHSANRPGDDPARAPFIAGQSNIPYAGRVFTEDEVHAAVSSTLDFWLTLGPEGEAFEKELSAILGVRHSLLVNSGSSANLVALSALTTHKLPPHKRIQPGDEVITCAAGFPTTVAPIIQCGAVPVFIDNDPATGNARVGQLEAAYSPGKTKAVMMAHTLGNPFDLAAVLKFCRRHDLWLIEDNCDALGCTYSMPVETARGLDLGHLLKIAEAGTHPLIRFEELKTENRKLLTAPTGAWGDLSTQSFYPPHHLTMGEGGAVNIAKHPPLKTYAESFRDWGRDCWCPSGRDNTCGKRFGWNLGELPPGYDHKYTYSHFGYNLKPLDPQAAIGRAQLKKLPAFIEARKKNWEYLRSGLADLGEFFGFSLPTHATAWQPLGTLQPPPAASSFSWDATGCRTDCSWFGFMLRVEPSAPFTHAELARHLDENKIGNRMLFGGNLLRQPLFVQLKKDRPGAFRTTGEYPGADSIMNTALFLGTYPGLTREMLDYEIQVIRNFLRAKKKPSL